MEVTKLEEERIAAVVDKMLNSSEGKLRKQIDSLLKEMKSQLVDEIQSELSLAVRDITKLIPNDLLGGAIGKGLNSALGSALNGSKLDARSIANSAASVLNPSIRNLFNFSEAQQGDELLGALSRAQRNS